MHHHPLLSLALHPRTAADAERIGRGLQALMLEDPTIRARTDAASGDVVIGGMGEQQLEIVVARLAREFEVSATISRLEVGYVEVVTRGADGEAKYAEHVDGESRYAHVKLRAAPGEPGSGYVFSNDIISGAVPDRFIETIRDSIQNALGRGVLAGYPVTDIRVSLRDGSYHQDGCSNEAFAAAASMALIDALRKATPQLVEPMMRIQIAAPPEYFEEVLRCLGRRRPSGLFFRQTISPILAYGPLSNFLGFAADLRAVTAGRFSLMMAFARYAPPVRKRRGDSDEGERDGGLGVREPLKPRPAPRNGSIAIPLDGPAQ